MSVQPVAEWPRLLRTTDQASHGPRAAPPVADDDADEVDEGRGARVAHGGLWGGRRGGKGK